MTVAPLIRSRPVPTLTLCVICAGPVPISSGRDLCLGCLEGAARPEPERPRVGGAEVSLRRRLEPRRLSAATWAVLDAVAAREAVSPQLAARTVVQAGLVVVEAEGYRLTPEGVEAHRTRQAPPRAGLTRVRLSSERERQARHRARIRAARHTDEGGRS